MRVKAPHAQYIASKISLDLLNSEFVKFLHGREIVTKTVAELILKDIVKEDTLEAKVRELLSANEEEIEFMQVDYRQLFWMTKKKLAEQENFILNKEDRYSALSHTILDELWENDLIEYSVTENKVKNVIYGAIEDYIHGFEEVEDIVIEKISHYKRKLIPGTEEYDLIYQRLYEEELAHKGIL